ncbi:MAG: methyltransferase [Candidatus Azobacteroides sp.]|nr:methyltransferase [Candidatus Azobacteroides sp.]
MPNPYFQFKQFTVFHDQCAMKVGTDGVLLGAWANCSTASHILDAGTGSGLIALMLAQRSKALIDALDIDEGACRQVKFNVENSKFKDQIHIIHSDFKDFTSDKKYDLIVSNPPYFSNSLQAPDKRRSLARHNHALSFEELIGKSASLLTEKGTISLILPVDAENVIHSCAGNNGLFLCRKTFVRSKPEIPPKRILIEYSKIDNIPEISALYIEKERHVYGDEFRKLTEEFYL